MAPTASVQEGDRIVIELYPGQPVELGDLSSSFAALARMYERHYRKAGEDAPKLHVTKLETGSVIMEIAPFCILMGAITVMDNGIVVADFTNRLWRGIKAFSADPSETPRIDPPSLDDACDIREFTKPLLGKYGAALGIKHAKYEKQDGKKKIVVSYNFDEKELNRAAINIERALQDRPKTYQFETAENEVTAREQIKREVMLFMEQTNRGPGKEKGRTGDRGVIPEISDKALPVYFRRSFQSLKAQMTKQVNAMTCTFVVDVHVQYVGPEPKGYIVTNIHQAIPEADGD